jgi:hypothetical protein
MESGQRGSPTACFCSRKSGERARVVSLLSGCTGILNAMQPFMQVFPYSAISPRIFPAHPRSLASVLIPRPAALAVLLRTSCALRVWVSKQKSTAQQARGYGPECGRDFSSEPPQKARLRPWERAHSRRFAQECPEGNPGKYKQGETRWHSTKTTSS